MTTIAVKDGILASDTKCTSNYTLHGYINKYKKTESYIAACSGNIQEIVAFFEWIERGEPSDAKPDLDGFAAIVIKEKRILHYESKLYCYELSGPFFAIGSGSDLAMGAMAAGATATEAVRIASRFDIATGGVVNEVIFG